MTPEDQPSPPGAAPHTTRRELLRQGGLLTVGALGLAGGLELLSRRPGAVVRPVQAATAGTGPVFNGPYDAKDKVSSLADITGYNNYYEFGLDKSDPAANAGQLKTHPWAVTVDGLVRKPQTLDVDALVRQFPPVDRLYRMRCVEGWSLVIPWHGFELGRLLRAVEPLSTAKYVKFTALYDPKQMPGQREAVLQWPYTEGLRLDEAMHPLTLLATGLDGRALPNQNGAPIRLVVPWKYGLKNIKAIVRITLTSEQPQTTWNLAAPNEYGFYGNVNPAVDHPRWSQATERRIGQFGRIPTLPFNGYGPEVAQLYKGMDLRRYF